MFVWVRAATLPTVIVRTETSIRISSQLIEPARSQGELRGEEKAP